MGLRLRVSSNKDRTRDPWYKANGLSTIVLVMRLFYFSYKQVKHDFSLLRAYAIICGRFNITVN